MNAHFSTGLVVVVALLSGCAAAKHPISTTSMATASAGAKNGTLLVYSAFEDNADFNARDPNRPEYTDYNLLAADGRRLRRIHNNSGTILQSPVPVSLAPGKYTVVAQANGHGLVTIPVFIQSHQKTVLHLEGGSLRESDGIFQQTNVVPRRI